MTSLDRAADIKLAAPGSVTCRTFTRSGLKRLARGVYGQPPDTTGLNDHQRQKAEYIWFVKAVMSTCEDKGAVLYGPSGMQVSGVALPKELEDWEHCHILVPDGKSRPRREGVISHNARRAFKVWRIVHGLPILHPVELWLQLRGATDDQMIEVGDGFIRRQHPLLTLDEIKEHLSKCAGLTGVPQAQRVLKYLVPGTDSLMETRTRMILIRGGLPWPEVNPTVYTSAGTDYLVDMAYPAEKVGVEYDGGWHGTEAQMRSDAFRRRLLQDDGWLLIPVTAPDLEKKEQIVRSVETALLMRRGVPLRNQGVWAPI